MKIDLKKAHKHSSHNRESIEKSKYCCCFFCRETFEPNEIEEWIDDCETALCPKCSIDSVIGNYSGIPVLNKEFIKRMFIYYFGVACGPKDGSEEAFDNFDSWVYHQMFDIVNGEVTRLKKQIKIEDYSSWEEEHRYLEI